MNERACDGVGIDLGTTYSSLAYMDAQMTPRVVANSEGQTVMPSVVYFDDDEIIVGDVALSQAKLNADRVVQFVKVFMGDEWRKEFNDQTHTPESISALILGQLIREAEPEIGKIPSAVITVPAYFTEKRRRATQQAGEIAGLNVLGTLNEPMSAALAYGLHQTKDEQFAVVYDLGGGTFDVTVVRITPNELEELATNGNRQLGGRDWDQALIDFVCDDFKEKHDNDLRDDLQAIQDLQIECEKIKRRLGRMAKTSVRLHAFGHDHIAEVTRELFESLTAHLVQATKLTTEIAVEDAGLDFKKISRIVLVGGSTHIPAVRRMLKDVTGIAPDTGVNPVVAVALGAATYAHMLETGNQLKAIHQQPDVGEVVEAVEAEALDEHDEDLPVAQVVSSGSNSRIDTADPVTFPTVKFVTAHGVGIKVRADGQWRNAVLIPKNSTVPCKVTKRFRTTGRATAATSHISVAINQGDTPDANLVEHLGTGRIQVPGGEEAGQPVDVSLEFDEQGRLHAHAVYVRTSHEMKMTVDVAGGLREEEVERFRSFMQETGFVQQFDAEDALAQLEDIDDEDLAVLEPEEPAAPCSLDDDEDLPMIEII